MTFRIPTYQRVSQLPKDGSVQLAFVQPTFGFSTSDTTNTPDNFRPVRMFAFTGQPQREGAGELFYYCMPYGAGPFDPPAGPETLPDGWVEILLTATFTP